MVGSAPASPYCCVVPTTDGVRVLLEAPAAIIAVEPKRLTTAGRIFRKAMRRQGGSDRTENAERPVFEFQGPEPAPLREELERLERILAHILEAPLPPRAVDRVLSISSQERLRWSKDGRLPPVDTRRSNRCETSFSMPLFSIWSIAALKNRPSVLDAWRATDRRRAPDAE